MNLIKPFRGNYPITQAYGVQSVTGGKHMGIDWALYMYTPVLAAAEGTVIFAGSFPAYGNMVLIGHADGSGTVYAHLQAIMVKAGEYVVAGINVGQSGTTGNSTGPHLHFEYRLKYDDWKSAVDPMPYFNSTGKSYGSDVKAEIGTVVVVAPAGVRIRMEPNLNYGKVLDWAFSGEEYEKTGRIMKGSDLDWAEIKIKAYIAIQDADGTQLLRDVFEEIYE